MAAAMTDDRLAALAAATGLPASAWAALSPGWADGDALRAVRAGGAGWAEDRPDGAWAIPERSGDGRTVGLSLRAPDGRKGSPAGAKRGLVVPADLHDRPDPVLVVEGASDVAACCAMGLAAVGRPSNLAGSADLADLLDGREVLIVGERDGKPGGAWPGRDGAKSVAGHLSARWGEPVAWTLPPAGAKDIRAWLGARMADGLVVSDRDAMHAAGAELSRELVAAEKKTKPERRTQADAIVDLARAKYRIGRSDDGECFAVPTAGPSVALMLRAGGTGLRAALAKSYRAATGKTPSASALADAMLALEGIAQDADPEPVALRVAEHGGAVVLDLADASGRAAVVSPDGWRVDPASPVLFRRTALTGAIPEPSAAEPGALAELRGLLNVDDDSWPLLVGWLVAAMMPGIPHPVLMFGGEQGTGKSTAARLLVGLVDPSAAPLRSEPRDLEQWAVGASGSWCVALDNVSHISGWLSDAICKSVTGDGLVRRKLYTDGDLAVLSFRRCIVMTSIDPGAMRGDLADRLLLADLERIGDDRRRTEADLEAAYQAARPRLLGALLSATARTLAALPGVHLATMPRMADFARVLAALDVVCPELTGGRALELFAGQRQRVAGEVVESDAVAGAIIRLMDGRTAWAGTAAELLDATTPTPAPRGWPASARGLSGHLRRVTPALRTIGLTVTFDRATSKNRARMIHIEMREGGPSGPSGPSDTDDIDAPEAFGGGRSAGRSGRLESETGRSAGRSGRSLLSDRPSENAAGASETGIPDGPDGPDGQIHPISADDADDWIVDAAIDDADDLAEAMEERAAILEYEAGFDRAEAERMAYRATAASGEVI